MGVERPNVVLYTLGGPRGSYGWVLLSYLYPHFIFCHPAGSCATLILSLAFAVLLGIESLRLGFRFSSPSRSLVSLSNRPRQKTCQPLPGTELYGQGWANGGKSTGNGGGIGWRSVPVDEGGESYFSRAPGRWFFVPARYRAENQYRAAR